ncbi:MAG: small multi-drug export protein [Minisyncoccia bacterium]
MDYIGYFQELPPELSTFLISMLPIAELRGAIPVAIGVYHLNPITTLILAIAGNIVPVIFILKYIEPVSGYLMKRSRILNRFFTWLFERTRRKYNGDFEKWGPLALITFVAIPLPMTGGYSGAIAAFVFGIPFKKALLSISIGVILAGLIVMGLTLGILKL